MTLPAWLLAILDRLDLATVCRWPNVTHEGGDDE